MRVLIAEDDPALASFVRKGLEAEHYAVDVTTDGEQARAMAGELDYDLFMLDLNLPRVDGVTILRHLRTRKPSLPILVLTSRNRVEDRVQCLDLGADDYMGKPFSFAELSARIRALLRRSHLPAAAVLAVADLKLDRVERRVERAGKRIELTSKEFGLLEYFMLNAGRRVTRAMIIEHVWNLSFDTGTNVIDVYVNYLRISFQAALVSAEHLSYREYVSSVPEGTYLASCRLAPFGARGLIQLDLGVSFALIDVLLGGEGQGQPPSREITEIEDQVLETVMRIICRELQTAWSALPLEYHFEQREKTAQVQYLLPPDERVLCLSFEVTMKDCRGTMSVIVPAVVSSALLRKLSVATPKAYTQLGSENSAPRLKERLLSCGFRMHLGMGVRASSQRLAGLREGALLAFNRSADETCELSAGTHPVLRARVARLGNNRAAQITDVIEENPGRKRLV